MGTARRCGCVAAMVVLGATIAAHAATPSVNTAAAAGSTSLMMDSGGVTVTRIVKVADVSVASDGANGFTLSIASAALTKPGGTPVPFQVALVDAFAPVPSASAFSTPAGSLFAYVGTGIQNKALYIKYSLPTYQDPGTYSAQIDLEVVDN
jgi:hypothetical protein